MDNDQRAQVGARIIAARGSQGLSQEELSSRAGITANTLRRIERGDKVHAGNLSDQVIDPTTATFTASHNGELAEQVVDLDERSGLDEVWSLPRLRPGKTVSFSLGFVGEASGQWDLDLGATDRTLMWSSDGAK